MRSARVAPTLLLAALLVATSCARGGPDGRDDAAAGKTRAELLDRPFLSIAVTEGGEPRPLVEGTRIRVIFFKKGGGQVGVRWRAGCNTFGAGVEITADRLLVGEIGGTDQGCFPQYQAQDEWLTEFFGSDPRWELRDERLTLRSRATVITLESRMT